MKIVQKIICVLLCALLPIMTYTPTASATTMFADTYGSEYKDGIEFLANRGVVKGYPNGNFAPFQSITRAELLKIAFEGAKVNVGSGKNCFPDIHDEWYAKYVCYAKANKLIKGYPDGTFQADKKVIFAEGIKIGLNVFNSGIKENTGSNYWYEPYLNYLHDNNVFSKFAIIPYNEMSRGQMAGLVYKLVQEKEGTITFDNVRDVASAGCGLDEPATPPSVSMVNGDLRHYITVVGNKYYKNTPMKLIIAFHGRTNPNTMVRSYYGVEQASKGDAIIVYPSGLPEEGPTRSWSNPGDPSDNLRDFALFDEIVKQISSKYCINKDEIFVVGHSLGAWFTNSLACARGDVIRAIGSVAGGTTINKCTGPTAAIIMHNPLDTLTSFKSGEIARDQLLRQNSCGEPVKAVGPDGLNCRQYTCQGGAPVIRCPHDDSTDEHGNTYTHTRPDLAGLYIYNFFDAMK